MLGHDGCDDCAFGVQKVQGRGSIRRRFVVLISGLAFTLSQTMIWTDI